MNPTSDIARLRALAFAMAAAGLLGACATPPGQDKPAAGATPAGTPVRGTAPGPAGATPAAAPTPPVAEVPAGPPTVSAVQAAQRMVATAIELLEAGNEDQATAELQRALQSDPGNKLAPHLLRQISADPVGLLGRESFVYRVAAGESLSRIAQRFLGDVHLFYALARYNDLKVPKQLAGGQLIRIPGKAPAPTAAAPAPATVAAPAPAPVVVQTPSVVPINVPSAADKAEAEKVAAIARATRAARSAFARQDLTAAIKNWDTVLELEPNNSTARLERQKALDLKERLTKVK